MAGGEGTFKGGAGDEVLNATVRTTYDNTVYPVLHARLQKTGFFDIARRDVVRSDSFIIVDPVLALAVVEGKDLQGQMVANMGIAPGFIYLLGKTYSPFEFEFKGCVDLNDWDALSGIIGKKESLENKKEYSKETINQSGNINFLYCDFLT
jgi:hypothetical protein